MAVFYSFVMYCSKHEKLNYSRQIAVVKTIFLPQERTAAVLSFYTPTSTVNIAAQLKGETFKH